ncbi:MAG: tryptophan-rich sensory protein [Candidatus Hydrogenedentes bacterium]|nr:tryptophan-rich sensory protein [Candidatus Hydrogenedentota bacterium]
MRAQRTHERALRVKQITSAVPVSLLYQAAALCLFLFLAYGAAAIGGAATATSVGTWYPALNKPAWTPAGSTIGTVWSILYFLIGLSAWRVWLKGGLRMNAMPLGAWAVQLVLNTLWSVVFFGLQQPGWAFAELVLLWLAILATMLLFFRKDRIGGILFLPYLAWVTFAGFLNATLWRMNV